MPTVGEALALARQHLMSISETSILEARILLSHVVGQSPTWLFAHPEASLTPEQEAAYQHLIQQRQQGHPVAYLIGRREFYQWEFAVNDHVLIPRPETELLVEKAVAWLNARTTPDSNLCVVDVGTGSGIIAISIALLCPTATVYATDISPDALVIAQSNAHRLGASVQFAQGDLLIPAQADLIVANLPYIARDELSALAVAQFEPHLALDGGPDGLDLIRRLLHQIPQYWRPKGCILLEIGANQGAAARELASNLLGGVTISLYQDLAGLDRIVEINYDSGDACQ